MDNGIEILETVALTADVPQLNLQRGQVGTVVEVLAESRAFEVEFCDREGRTYASLGLRPDQLRVVRSASAAQHDLPSHAFEPPFPRADPLFQNVIDVARHGFAEEEQLTEEVKRFIAASREPIQLQDSMLRDGELYLLVTIGVGIATW